MFFIIGIILYHLLVLQGASAIRNVQLLVPPIVRAGTSATLLCLYDLEHAPLYSVKWYRGQHEFFRYMPKENPPIKAFQIAGFYVDMFTSNQHQVILHNVPTFIAGEISCEITTDSPTFSTACVSDILKVQKMNIDLHVPRAEYRPGENLVADCATSIPAKLLFYLNSYRVPSEFVVQGSSHSATLNLTLKDDHFTPKGDFRLQCSGGISDQYYISTRLVNIRRITIPDLTNSQNSTSKYNPLLLLIFFYTLLALN